MIDIALLQVVLARGAGDAVLRRLAKRCANEQIGPGDIIEAEPDEIAKTLSIKVDVASSIVHQRESALQLADSLESKDIAIIWMGHQNYPKRLLKILREDAPPLLFVKGNQNILNQPAIGFCGSRKASEKGLEVTRNAASLLADSGVCVVSGYASGVDLAAHGGALQAGGTTTFVLVEGILRFQRKRDIAPLLTDENHLVVSQFPPNLPWTSRNAMRRNTTIIGLSDAMILVESGLSGGTFAAGMESVKRRHPLFVVEFAQPNGSAAGNAVFLERGGIPIRGNRERVPKLDRVIEVTKHPPWQEAGSSRELF